MPTEPPTADAEVLPPAPWQRVPQRGPRRRRDPITREAIVEAALDVLDTEGLDGLSMRRIGDKLGTGAATLYWHVGSKDGLLDLLLDEIIGEIHIPDPDPERWREQLKGFARAQRAAILRHRDVVRISVDRVPMGPNALRLTERVLAILRAGGTSDRLAVQGYLLLIAVINGFTIDETGTAAAQGTLDESARMVHEYFTSLPAQRFPNLVNLAEHFTITDPDQRFELLLDLYVDGLTQRAT